MAIKVIPGIVTMVEIVEGTVNEFMVEVIMEINYALVVCILPVCRQ